MKKILLFVLIIILIVVGLGYLALSGKVPSLTNAALKQVELGVRETPDEIYSFYDDIGYVNNLKGETPKSGELVFEGGIELDHTFTQSEINSWIAGWEKDWSDLPFKNSQIRINGDGTVEASSSISIPVAESFAKMLGYTQEDINKAKTYLKYIPDPLPLYAKGRASITENNAIYDIESLKIGGYTVPNSLNNSLADLLENITAKTRELSSYTNVKEAIVTSEGVKFVGTVPASVDIK
ncbi:hypothetical protein CVU76_01440 [Candidatus Dojkabacteria bacterium HGW-Dojkabacteria-1]|uniref:Uncharacterized protein n=1 Tax=Candidatus Dojkabacteria bacterium HGW-Dojkabacteria-1 TaxID=2013761 RepID=A0A2N2F386_9BACT|nr:MAG: hypothetical protein CVU76_01440 [Candidatus Dojkabacteria bacterium HGW-Dojkabacteria-1]